jgi:hypothetical protein
MATWVEARDEAANELVAGAPAQGEFRCTGCGYGVTVYRQLPRCPMCGAEGSWEQLDFARAFENAFGDADSLL